MKILSYSFCNHVGGGVLTGCKSFHAEPKKLLVVTTTTGFRHSSIPTAEKILDATRPGQRRVHRGFCPAAARPHAGNGFPAKLKDNATPEEKKAI